MIDPGKSRAQPRQAMETNGAPFHVDSMAALRALAEAPPLASGWMCIDQALITTFADLTDDHHWLHVDPERTRRETAFPGTIAHGLLTLSLVPALYKQCVKLTMAKGGLNYGFDRIRFTAPVPAGANVRGIFQLKQMEPSPGQAKIAWDVQVQVEGSQRAALVATWLMQVSL